MIDYKTSILKWMMTAGKTSIVSIATGLGISVPTVSKFLRDLVNDGMVNECGIEDSTRGRKPMMYMINPEACCFMGIDIKHTHLDLMAIDLAGNEIAYKTVDNDFEFSSTPAVLERICDEARIFIAENLDPERLRFVSWNISGRVNSATGYSYSIFNFEGDENPLSAVLTEKLGYPVVIENDTRAMAYGESLVGDFGNFKNAIYINFSWGLGMAMLINGEIFNGTEGYAGEIGHVHAYENDIMCHCGKKGCLETVVSVSAITRRVEHELRSGKTTVLRDRVGGRPVRPSDIAQAVQDGDPLAMEIVEEVARELGKHIANFINIFNPEAVIIGGAEYLISDFFVITVQQAVAKYALRLMAKNVVIERSHLDHKAGALGACLNSRRVFLANLK